MIFRKAFKTHLFKWFLAERSLITLNSPSFNDLVHFLHNFLCFFGSLPRSYLNLLLPQTFHSTSTMNIFHYTPSHYPRFYTRFFHIGSFELISLRSYLSSFNQVNSHSTSIFILTIGNFFLFIYIITIIILCLHLWHNDWPISL